MKKHIIKSTRKKTTSRREGTKSYRLKCARTANGLSHFVMYGDVPKQKTLV